MHFMDCRTVNEAFTTSASLSHSNPGNPEIILPQRQWVGKVPECTVGILAGGSGRHRKSHALRSILRKIVLWIAGASFCRLLSGGRGWGVHLHRIHPFAPFPSFLPGLGRSLVEVVLQHLVGKQGFSVRRKGDARCRAQAIVDSVMRRTVSAWIWA